MPAVDANGCEWWMRVICEKVASKPFLATKAALSLPTASLVRYAVLHTRRTSFVRESRLCCARLERETSHSCFLLLFLLVEAARLEQLLQQALLEQLVAAVHVRYHEFCSAQNAIAAHRAL